MAPMRVMNSMGIGMNSKRAPGGGPDKIKDSPDGRLVLKGIP